MREAESVKLHYGCADESSVDPQGCVEVNGVGGRPPRVVSRKFVAEIIQPRMEEIFEMVLECIGRSGHRTLLTSGIVLCGGSSMMPGVVDVASQVTGMPVRLGEPMGCVGLSYEVDDPSWATAVGLARGVKSQDLHSRAISGLAARVLPEWFWRRWRGHV